METKKTLALILAGGVGSRLYPLTKDRAKPAVPFGGIYRLIDFTLSNCANSNIRRICIIPQYKSLSLDRHIRLGWNVFNPDLGEYIISLHPQQRIGEQWYRGTADAIYQNIYFLEREKQSYIFVLSGDHVYKMNYNLMLKAHIEKNADLTVATIPFERKKASQFGVVEVDDSYRITGFEEKPKNPKAFLSDQSSALVSMGVYVFKTNILYEALHNDAWKDTEHDFGRDVIPMMISNYRVFGFIFREEDNKQVKYWRDVGTVDAYWEANMDLLSVKPAFSLYDEEWPIRTYQGQYPPAKLVVSGESSEMRAGLAQDSLISSGSVISGARVNRSVLSPNVYIHRGSEVEESVILDGVDIGRYCKIKRAIIDKEVKIPQGTTIGLNPEEDRKRFFVSDTGIVVVPKEMSL
ncbi:MAG: glucose-1-phosphate adenylyltransferase [Candidatus Schekmanbacteria bacterium GWA2_38_9]|uniref:Glucose-1-phosphate adenylyltransferase n=1 Tax=Candidatus Schekmanbacteria bacterium RIFCSPLOWO2_12_FULL_38_15 TaxID=1817883 RepID=A0A1F7SQH5_9BACT|nr:MAG: glucose-1-phosphate adenylyltransferase [Candidatus Schekmanbacteria bacterium GWA2_38_9]OGL50211.1 MAG: glucose-1-phosphate adenylyltransferase [Candidatus Schekmanbacteria bacterium RIFCSPLOWO2_02_FULL_38_14]OGL55478.1 MAG: glucose-1-phosphate adenylyltransferase [Candidatus Schekmanbacteria bacterium RIFCSPLOWO2_12_FULL_38_15]